jgi:hypothetical protein
VETSDEAAAAPPAPARASPRRRLLPLAVLAGGAVLAALYASKGPREQHVRYVLGAHAPDVTALDIQYVGESGEVVRQAHLAFEPGRAPRIVAHDPTLPDAAYQLLIEVDTREGRRSAERQVRLGSGTTSVDLSRVLETPP